MSPRASSQQAPEKDSARRRRYALLGTIAFLGLAVIATRIFLHRTSVGSPRFVRMTFLLWAATIVVALALLILATVLGRNLIKLYFEHKRGQVGSRFKTKIVSTFVALSLLPASLLFFLSYGLVDFSIEQWFSAPAAQMLQNSRLIAEQYYEETHQRARHFATQIALEIGSEAGNRPEAGHVLDQRLEGLRRSFAVDDIRVFDSRGMQLAESGKRVSPEGHSADTQTLVSLALGGQPGSRVERSTPKDALQEVLWASAPIIGKDAKVKGVVLTESLITSGVHFRAYSVMEAYGVYEQLEREKSKLRFNFILILALSTLLIVFAFSWFAMYLAKRITIPIQALAEGAAAVAAGDLDYRVVCEAFDELENLVVSFNRMTTDLKENKARIEAAQEDLRQTNVKLDDRRRYIETILQTIATGVLSLDSQLHVRTMNRAAYLMLQVQGAPSDMPLEEVVQGPAAETIKMLLHKSAVLGPVVRNIELALPGKTLHLATTVTPLLDSAGQRRGWVVVLDDVTELLRMEKLSAWREVARRLAHEIKNPLTPIQLSAERMLRRYKQVLPKTETGPLSAEAWQTAFGSFDNLLEECVRTITQEANSLKNLVDEFSRFARLPEVHPEPADLHRVLENTLSLYDGRIHDIRLVKEFGTGIPLLQLDPEQMKRVFINLFDNALEAMSEITRAKVLKIRTVCNKPEQSVRVEISDTGRGFPKEYQDSLFLPYFSTRNGGTGLGLAIVRQVISDHHGYVRAEPNLPLGTTIIIDLPLSGS